MSDPEVKKIMAKERKNAAAFHKEMRALEAREKKAWNKAKKRNWKP